MVNHNYCESNSKMNLEEKSMLSNDDKKSVIKNVFDLSKCKLKNVEVDFLYELSKGFDKFKDIIVKTKESHDGWGSDGKYIMTTEKTISFVKNGIKKIVNVVFDDNTKHEPTTQILKSGRDIINEVKEHIDDKAFDKVRNIVDKLK